MTYSNLAKFFLIVSVAMLFFKKNLFFGPYGKISDIALLVSAITTTVGIYFSKIEIPTNLLRKWALPIILILVFPGLGIFLSLSIFHTVSWIDVLNDYLRLCACVVSLILVIIHSYKDMLFLKILILSSLTYLCVIPLIYLAPTLIKNGVMMDSSNFRFSGLSNDPNYFSNLMILPLTLVVYLFLEQKKISKVFFYTLLALILGLLVWSGSRSGWIGALGAILIFIIIEKVRKNKIGVVILALIIAIPLGVLMLPSIGKENIKARSEPLVNIRTGIGNLTRGQDRKTLWIQATKKINANYLGYGPGYSKNLNIHEKNRISGTPHNSLLEILLIGGIPLLLIIIFSAIKIFLPLVATLKTEENIYVNIIIIAFIGMSISAFFIDAFYSQLFWILAALAIVYQNYKEYIPETLKR